MNLEITKDMILFQGKFLKFNTKSLLLTFLNFRFESTINNRVYQRLRLNLGKGAIQIIRDTFLALF